MAEKRLEVSQPPIPTPLRGKIHLLPLRVDEQPPPLASPALIARRSIARREASIVIRSFWRFCLLGPWCRLLALLRDASPAGAEGWARLRRSSSESSGNSATGGGRGDSRGRLGNATGWLTGRLQLSGARRILRIAPADPICLSRLLLAARPYRDGPATTACAFIGGGWALILLTSDHVQLRCSYWSTKVFSISGKACSKPAGVWGGGHWRRFLAALPCRFALPSIGSRVAL